MFTEIGIVSEEGNMHEIADYVDVQNSFLKAVMDWSRVDLVGFTALAKDSSKLLHQAMFYGAEQKKVFSSTRTPNTCCDVVIKTSAHFAIEANSNEPFGATCPMMTSQGYEAYLGVPIINNGMCVGALELMDKSPRLWTPRQINKLQEFSNVINVLIQIG